MDENIKVKAELARRQLGAALHLFLEDFDPVAVHCLACGGAELADFLATGSNKGSFVQHALRTNPELKIGELVALRNRYWNAMKHATARDGRVRDDKILIDAFDDEHNDHVLFIGWHDYVSAIGSLPIEAQVLQAWYFAKYPEKLAKGVSPEQYDELFPKLGRMSRTDQKREIGRVIELAKTWQDVMDDPQTDTRPLMSRGGLGGH